MGVCLCSSSVLFLTKETLRHQLLCVYLLSCSVSSFSISSLYVHEVTCTSLSIQQSNKRQLHNIQCRFWAHLSQTSLLPTSWEERMKINILFNPKSLKKQTLCSPWLLVLIAPDVPGPAHGGLAISSSSLLINANRVVHPKKRHLSLHSSNLQSPAPWTVVLSY